MIKYFTDGLFIALCLQLTAARAQQVIQPNWGDFRWWGDQGNGFYENPVLPADFSDIDCIRVGENYYAVSSTFQFSPGMVILQSKDMVNWFYAGHVVNNLSQISGAMKWTQMNRYGRGIWAGSIRFHSNKFWIYFGTPDEGFFMSTAEKIIGPWQPLHQVLNEAGWDDCCPFWDDDGKGYLVGTHFSDNYKTWLFRLTPDGKGIIKNSGKIINEGYGREANKLYRINSWYYHLFSEYKEGVGRYLMMQRAKNIEGPYEESKQLNQADTAYHEPNQGGLVQTQKGNWYFYTHHGSGDWAGRINSLLPVTWISGWPIIGKVGRDTVGTMVWSGKKPVQASLILLPETNDEFSTAGLKNQWEWNYQPRDDKWSLTEKKGWLRLHAFKPLSNDDLFKAGNTLTQRSWRTGFNTVIIKISVSGMADGQKAGLCHFAFPQYASLGVVAKGEKRFLQYRNGSKHIDGPLLRQSTIWLKSTWGLQGVSRFAYSLDGKKFIGFGDSYQLAWGAYRGDRVGIYCYNNKGGKGYADIDFFHYERSKKEETALANGHHYK